MSQIKSFSCSKPSNGIILNLNFNLNLYMAKWSAPCLHDVVRAIASLHKLFCSSCFHLLFLENSRYVSIRAPHPVSFKLETFFRRLSHTSKSLLKFTPSQISALIIHLKWHFFQSLLCKPLNPFYKIMALTIDNI